MLSDVYGICTRDVRAHIRLEALGEIASGSIVYLDQQKNTHLQVSIARGFDDSAIVSSTDAAFEVPLGSTVSLGRRRDGFERLKVEGLGLSSGVIVLVSYPESDELARRFARDLVKSLVTCHVAEGRHRMK